MTSELTLTAAWLIAAWLALSGRLCGASPRTKGQMPVSHDMRPRARLENQGAYQDILHAVGNAPLVVPPSGGFAADIRLKPVLRTCLISSRVQDNCCGKVGP